MNNYAGSIEMNPETKASFEGKVAEASGIVAQDLKAYFGNVEVLKGINISIAKRGVTAFIGPSGCGKTTFLRTLNRMHELAPNAYIRGRVMVDGTDIYSSNIDPVLVRRKIGMVFQKPNPFPTMSVYDNVVAGLKLTGRHPRKELDEVVEKTLVQAALWDEVKDSLHKSGVSLSGGQQQRLCIARTLAVNPEVILMDEPASALDPISTAKIEELIFQLKDTYTIIIVTHNMQQAARVSDFTAFFYLGELVEFSSTSDMFTRPKKKQTEDYITGRFG